MERTPSQVGEYLRTRRSLVQPEDVGLPRDDTRRVAGLRRHEVAALAGISFDYYLRLEQGKDRHPSVQVIWALARALRLTPAATAYVERLAQPEARTTETVDIAEDRLQLLLERFGRAGAVPAFVVDGNHDVVMANALARRLGEGGMSPGANRVFETFGPRLRGRVPDWGTRAAEITAALRMTGDPSNARFREVVSTLLDRDRDFRAMWARHDVHVFTDGVAVVPVRTFGAISLEWQSLEVPGGHGLIITTYFAKPGTTAAGALAFMSAEVALQAGFAGKSASTAP